MDVLKRHRALAPAPDKMFRTWRLTNKLIPQQTSKNSAEQTSFS